jgi:hypothetical protein
VSDEGRNQKMPHKERTVQVYTCSGETVIDIQPNVEIKILPDGNGILDITLWSKESWH